MASNFESALNNVIIVSESSGAMSSERGPPFSPRSQEPPHKLFKPNSPKSPRAMMISPSHPSPASIPLRVVPLRVIATSNIAGLSPARLGPSVKVPSHSPIVIDLATNEEEELKKKKEIERLEKEKERQEKRERKEREKKRKQEELNEKTRKQAKVTNNFMKYFKKQSPAKAVSSSSETRVGPSLWYKPFFVKPGVTLVKRQRVGISVEEKGALDQRFKQQSAAPGRLYLSEIKGRTLKRVGRILRGRGGGGSPSPAKSHHSDDVVVMEKAGVPAGFPGLRAKFLQFHETHRPAYFGTWRKRSRIVRPRAPLQKDAAYLNYDIDSADEWEEEEPGESIADSEDDAVEMGAQGDEDEDEDDGFFVPHGYLSADEGGDSDEETSTSDPDKRREMARQSDLSRKSHSGSMKPVIIGCLWQSENGALPTTTVKSLGQPLEMLMDKLKSCSLCPLTKTPISVSRIEVPSKPEVSPVPVATPIAVQCQPHATVVMGGSAVRPVSVEAMPHLIRFVHGNSFGLNKLISVFQAYWKSKLSSESSLATQTLMSRRQLEMKIREIATKEAREPVPWKMWYVNPAVIAQWELEASLPVPNLVFADEVLLLSRLCARPQPSTPLSTPQHLNTPAPVPLLGQTHDTSRPLIVRAAFPPMSLSH